MTVILSHGIVAAISLLLGRALTEMAVAHPTAGAFGVYAGMYISRTIGRLGTIESWLVLIKVGAVVLFVGLALLIVLGRFVIYSFIGAEIVGVTSGEAAAPEGCHPEHSRRGWHPVGGSHARDRYRRPRYP